MLFRPASYTLGMPAISVQNLTKTYRIQKKARGLSGTLRGLIRREQKVVQAVRGVSFEIEPGEMVAFLGPNGAGKTTTLKLLSGLIFPTSGDATVIGHSPWKRSHDYRRRFSLVMGQKNQLWWDLPARESFDLHREIYRVEPATFETRVDELTELLQVTKLIDQPVRELSLGERMRMELIAALLHAPDVLFLDEPTIGLDVVSQRTAQEFLKRYQAERQTTVLLTSHYMKDVEALCDRVIIIDNGAIQHDGPLQTVVDRFGASKRVTVQFVDEVPGDLSRYGDVTKVQPPRATIEVVRSEVPSVLARLLDQHRIEDVSVSDRPLEEVIAELFAKPDTDEAGSVDEVVDTLGPATVSSSS